MGGHISSMLTIGSELLKNNVNVITCLPENLIKGEGKDEIKALYPLNQLIFIPESKNYYSWTYIKKNILPVVEYYDINIIHSFDFQSHIIARFFVNNFNRKVKKFAI